MPKYSIAWSAAERVMTVTLHGFWSDEDAAGYAASLRAAVARIGGGPFDLVADVSDLAAQSQPTILTYGDMAALIGAAGVRRLIVVNVSPLLLMQFRRAASTLPFERAASMAEAREMLRDGSPERRRHSVE